MRLNENFVNKGNEPDPRMAAFVAAFLLSDNIDWLKLSNPQFHRFFTHIIGEHEKPNRNYLPSAQSEHKHSICMTCKNRRMHHQSIAINSGILPYCVECFSSLKTKGYEAVAKRDLLEYMYCAFPQSFMDEVTRKMFTYIFHHQEEFPYDTFRRKFHEDETL